MMHKRLEFKEMTPEGRLFPSCSQAAAGSLSQVLEAMPQPTCKKRMATVATKCLLGLLLLLLLALLLLLPLHYGY